MALSAEATKQLELLNTPNTAFVANIIEYLFFKQQMDHSIAHEAQQKSISESRKTKVMLNCLKGHLKYISDDFDDPIPDFEEYM